MPVPELLEEKLQEREVSRLVANITENFVDKSRLEDGVRDWERRSLAGACSTLDLWPAAARTYEPQALVTHTTARNIELLVRFYDLTGETKFLARIPEALEWLDKLALPAGVAPQGRTHPTFVELNTNQPLYVHREDQRRERALLRRQEPEEHDRSLQLVPSHRCPCAAEVVETAKATPPSEVVKTSPLKLGAGKCRWRSPTPWPVTAVIPRT